MMTRLLLLALMLLAWPVFGQGDDRIYLPPPLLGPPKDNAYGPGLNADATGRPFRYETDTGRPLTIEPAPKPNAYGLGVDMDQYGRPVRAKPAW
jgi:hypothetical protein